MIIPPSLKPGDKIGLFATARKVSMEEMLPAIEVLQSWGLEVVMANNLFAEDRQFAGTDEQRTKGLQTLLDDGLVKAVIIARGGYGTIRVVDHLNFSKFIQNPKWIIGFSDLTVLHSHIHQNFDISTLHATVAKLLPENEQAKESLRKILFGETLNYKIDPYLLNRNGNAKGQLIGGNLSLLYALTGSKSDIKTDGKILFLEDLDEYLYHIDRMMLSLKRSGKLNRLSGLVVGGMSDMKDNVIPFGKTAEEIIYDAVKAYDYPVCFNFPAGHIPENSALVFGMEVELNVSEDSVRLNTVSSQTL